VLPLLQYTHRRLESAHGDTLLDRPLNLRHSGNQGPYEVRAGLPTQLHIPMTSSARPPKQDITALLQAWSRGDRAALDALLPAVYGELRHQAESYMRQQPAGHTLQTTALVHEAYLRLVDQQDTQWKSRAHFFGVAAKAMRSILVDHARAHRSAKRGAGAARLTLGQVGGVPDRKAEVDVLDLEEALQRLGELDPEKVRLVELRYYGGLSIEETAEVLEISPATLKRQWSTARAWLRRELIPSTG
jgi:RNA polymerase sigma-70 factor, ECF subfamily